MPKKTGVKLSKKAKKDLNNMLQNIIKVMDNIENECKTPDPTDVSFELAAKQKAKKEKEELTDNTHPVRMFRSIKEIDEEPKEFNGENIFHALIDSHEQLADMMQDTLASIIKEADAPPFLQGRAMTLHTSVSDVFNQVEDMFRELCHNYDHFIIKQDTLDLD